MFCDNLFSGRLPRKEERGKRKAERGKRREERGKRKEERGKRKEESGKRKAEAKKVLSITNLVSFYELSVNHPRRPRGR